jgi:hypothetical protein
MNLFIALHVGHIYCFKSSVISRRNKMLDTKKKKSFWKVFYSFIFVCENFDSEYKILLYVIQALYFQILK